MQNDRLLTKNDTKPLDYQTQQSDRGITKMPTIMDGLFQNSWECVFFWDYYT